jgi:hypothetical protein
MADTATVSAIQARQHACNSLTMRHVRWADSAALGDYIRLIIWTRTVPSVRSVGGALSRAERNLLSRWLFSGDYMAKFSNTELCRLLTRGIREVCGTDPPPSSGLCTPRIELLRVCQHAFRKLLIRIHRRAPPSAKAVKRIR